MAGEPSVPNIKCIPGFVEQTTLSCFSTETNFLSKGCLLRKENGISYGLIGSAKFRYIQVSGEPRAISSSMQEKRVLFFLSLQQSHK